VIQNADRFEHPWGHGKLTAQQRDAVLVEQTCRKIQQMFTLPPPSAFAFCWNRVLREVAADGGRIAYADTPASWSGARLRLRGVRARAAR